MVQSFLYGVLCGAGVMAIFWNEQHVEQRRVDSIEYHMRDIRIDENCQAFMPHGKVVCVFEFGGKVVKMNGY